MKTADYIFKSGPVKWAILYLVVISAISFFFASFRPPSITDNLNIPSDSSKTKARNVKESSLLPAKNKKKISDDKIKVKEEAVTVPVDLIKKYMDKYKATNFNDYHYPYTIDYQENLKNKNVIFYILVDDIFEENGRLYMKASKSYLGLNVYLKMQCNNRLAKKLKDTQYYTYIVAKITRINSIYFYTKGAFSQKRHNDDTDVNINLASNNINLMITGRCLDMFEK
ncbi:MAG: hypothetical protein P8Z35_05985 [Ignavibacteriaceae bacterium]|jgi:hypothetical protein